MTLTFAPLHPLFSARAVGIDLRAAPSDAATREIETAMDRYAVLVFRDQQLDRIAQFCAAPLGEA